MNRPLDITQRQVKAICEGARKAGCAAILEIGNVVVRLVPEDRVIPPHPDTAVDDEEDIGL